MSDFTLILRRARRYPQGDIVDIGVEGTRIGAIAPHLPTSAVRELDAAERLVSPPFVESHIHLDSALTAGEPRWNESGTLFEGIQIWGERKKSLSIDDVKHRALETLQQQAAQGVLWVRTHADVSEPTLSALKALLEVRDSVADWMRVQVVAFPQDGIYSHPKNLELLREAIALGADAIGGIPHYELTREDGVKSVETVFELAETCDRLVDIHCDEIDDEQSRFLEVMAACTIRRDMGSRVTASHTTAMGSYNNAYAQKLMGFLQRARLNLIANPLINITLQGRTDSYPKRRGVTRVKELWQQGLNVSFGHDCIQDPWYSLGTGNMLDVAWMGLHVCQMTGRAEIDACYEMVTTNGAKTLNVENEYGLDIGKPASFVVLDAIDPFDVLRRRARVKWVVSQGKQLTFDSP
ncbi:cytosine deaminase [Baaleninema simplex]|uniref:cytosine deaminase n=1 Tax=Baaleninema simplex TaxID=2862350 RepID=UPI00034BD538|nr:cytosine deaminase [Baaleninema simplex]